MYYIYMSPGGVIGGLIYRVMPSDSSKLEMICPMLPDDIWEESEFKAHELSDDWESGDPCFVPLVEGLTEDE